VRISMTCEGARGDVLTPNPCGDDAGGQRWCYNLVHGPVAQSVEQRIENPCVGGSIPPQATKIIYFKKALGPMLTCLYLLVDTVVACNLLELHFSST
jgi:hypothetical protein